MKLSEFPALVVNGIKKEQFPNFLWNAVCGKLFQGNTKWPFKILCLPVRLKCFIMIFPYKLRKYGRQNILAIKYGLPVFFLILSVFRQTIYWWKTSSHLVFDLSNLTITTSSCTTCAEVAVAPLVALCTDGSSASLWGCMVVSSDPVCSDFNFWEMLCLSGILHSAYVHGVVAPCSVQLCCRCTWF